MASRFVPYEGFEFESSPVDKRCKREAELKFRELLAEKELLNAIADAFSGSGRNAQLRKVARVVYRCKHGCFLGAVVPYNGDNFMLTRQYVHVVIGGVEFSTGSRSLAETARQGYSLQRGGGTYRRTKAGIDATRLSTCASSDIFRLNCRHVEYMPAYEDVLQDIERKRKASNKEVKVTKG